jgi:hypothetical protein
MARLVFQQRFFPICGEMQTWPEPLRNNALGLAGRSIQQPACMESFPCIMTKTSFCLPWGIWTTDSGLDRAGS